MRKSFNAEHAADIAAGKMEEKPIVHRKIHRKGVRRKIPVRVYPGRYIGYRSDAAEVSREKEEELSNQAEIAVYAAREAMAAAGKTASDIDAVIVACAYTQRAYPAIAIEVQNELGIEGFGFDMLLACSAATFGLHRAYDSLVSGSAKCVLAVNPELVTPQVNFCDRDSHFIFGDVSTAVIMERAQTSTSANSYEILSTKAFTKFSINIRSNFGHMSYANDVDPFGWDKLFHQSGRKVFEEVSLRCRPAHQRPPGESRLDAARCKTVLDSPGQYQYEQDGDETAPR